MPRSAGRLGWFLVWAVVFCDIGTSVYYVPGILYEATGDRAGFFVLSTMAALVLIAGKIVEVARRFPGGGGVVSLADQAFGPWWGCTGGQLIMVDYFLTVAISALSGVYYIDSVLPLGGAVVPATLACLGVLCVLNIVGIRESARVSSVLAVAAFAVNLVVAGVALAHVPASAWQDLAAEGARLRMLTPGQALAGYAGAWLAFSGLESMAQLSPAMRDLDVTPRRGMIAVVATVLVMAPTLTFLSTLSLPPEVKATGSSRFISELAGVWGGMGLKLATVTTAATLLLFAANTAIIGNYHVQMALARRGFLPDWIGALSHRFQTPWRAILVSTLVPAAVVVVAGGRLSTLGELYAFGLLGCFVINSVGIDVLRWREGTRGLRMAFGVATSLAVLVAFGVNLVAKPSATLYGGVLTALGVGFAWASQRGLLDRWVAALPRMAPPTVEPSGDVPYRTVAQARTLPREDAPGILVAVRGPDARIFAEAAVRARARGQTRLFVLYVDEVPGLFYPQLAAPTPEGVAVLARGADFVRAEGLDPVCVWALSHSAAQSVADAADELGCDTVVIGQTQRTPIWTLLRGRFQSDLQRHLARHIRLAVTE